MAHEINTGEFAKPGRIDVPTLDPRSVVVNWSHNFRGGGQEPPVDEGLISLARDMAPRKSAGDSAEGTSGQINPITCRWLSDRRIEVVAGFRRLRAALWLIESGECPDFKIKCTVRQMSDAEAALINLVENIEREDLKPIEVAHAVRSLHEDYGMEMEAIAKRLKRSAAWLERITQLTTLPGDIQGAIVNGHMSANAGLTLAAMPSSEAREVFDAAKSTTGKVNATTVKEAQRRKKQEAKGEKQPEAFPRKLSDVRVFLESRTGPADSKKARETATVLIEWINGKRTDRQVNEFWDKL